MCIICTDPSALRVKKAQQCLVCITSVISSLYSSDSVRYLSTYPPLTVLLNIHESGFFFMWLRKKSDVYLKIPVGICREFGKTKCHQIRCSVKCWNSVLWGGGHNNNKNKIPILNNVCSGLPNCFKNVSLLLSAL